MSYRRHFTRLIIIVIVLIAGFLTVRSLLVPKSFGDYGHYRGANVAEQMALSPLYQGSELCSKCHQEQYRDCRESAHRSVSCEVCHGPWVIHNGNLKALTPPATADTCFLCHQQLPARPAAFPQIKSFVQHLKDQELSEEDASGCLDCHDPHSPL